ncbi:MAG: dockerin type I repeat-containing protein [Muribaculaceae bacterium]|nr:dockerin type I repeat-containing protein [Muribaculaceae bacterium]
MKTKVLFFAILLAMTVQAQNKPYITKVYDFMPAPGQFVNDSPKFEEGDTQESMIAKVESKICGSITIEEGELPDGTIVYDTTVVVKPGLISLGSFGGYVVFGFDHPVVNVAGEKDFQVFGNAFGSDSLQVSGGSCEPGVVMVSRDVNGNGIPDDPWYELAGSEYNNPRTQKNFTVTYYKPEEDHTAVPGSTPFITDMEYVHWTSNATDSVNEGYIYKLAFHTQSYWPGWAEGETLTFTGTKLPNNAENANETGQEYWVQYYFGWGYVDNRPDYGYGYVTGAQQSNQNLGFDIGWAVDENGSPKHLSQVDFIKVYSGMMQQCGWIGETSTEVCGGIDLHPDAVPVLRGDLDGNGMVDVSDVNIVINIILHKADPDAAADLNNDGVIDVEDVNSIINIILKI